MPPHEGLGGGTPRPRKDSDASARIAPPIVTDATTMIGAETLGRMCWKTIRTGHAPTTRAASTYGSVLIASVAERTIRQAAGRMPSESAQMMFHMLGPSAT